MKNSSLLRNNSFLFFNTILKKGIFILFFFVLFQTRANTSVHFNEFFEQKRVSLTSSFVSSRSFVFVYPKVIENKTGIQNDYRAANQIALPLFDLIQVFDFTSSNIDINEMIMVNSFSVNKTALC